eukprot:NODE_52_length_30984_cov_1.383358.p4 type:complete len:484 gc:universal NODE_52_length_30984_cov_1.383358:1792-341(-)
MELLLRLLTFNAPHSGYQDPPRFGDFQAHRHWMYMTNALPIEQWYFHAEDHIYQNQTATQWVLDYPPMTAYTHYLYGKTLPKTYEAHGTEDEMLVVKMRLFIFLIDLFLLYIIKKNRRFSHARSSDYVIILCHPILLLIDYIHYQPNNLMFLFLILSIYCVSKNGILNHVIGTISFIFCIASKQMALVYAPAIGMSYVCIILKQNGLLKKSTVLISLAGATLIGLMLCTLPFIVNYDDKLEGLRIQSQGIVKRIFPVHRGLYEDKLGNFWCISDVVFKWRRRFSEEFLAKLCTALCLLLTIPVSFQMSRNILKLKNPTLINQQVLLGCSITSFIGFMFGYHIHEKTIMLPIFTIIIYFANFMHMRLDSSQYILYKWLFVSSFNIFPLVVLDDSKYYFLLLHCIFYVIYKPKLLDIRFRVLIDVVYSPYLYTLFAILQAFPIFTVAKYPFIFNLLIYSFCFLGNTICLATLVLLLKANRDRKTV